MPKQPPRDPYMGVFENFMERLEERLYEAMDHVMDTAEQEVDRLITSTQHITNNGGKPSRKIAPRSRGKGVPRNHTNPPPSQRPKQPFLTLYDVLEISPRASQTTIDAAYRSMAKRFHPDLFQDPAEKGRMEGKMQLLNVAYGVLKDPVKRAAYDKEIRR